MSDVYMVNVGLNCFFSPANTNYNGVESSFSNGVNWNFIFKNDLQFLIPIKNLSGVCWLMYDLKEKAKILTT
jgi:hypothetical protein